MGTRTTVTAGSLLAGRYRLVEPLPDIAAGGWRGRDDVDDRDVAARELTFAPEEAEHTLRQRTIPQLLDAARLRHEGIVTVYDVVDHDGTPWIVTELVEGLSLDRVLRDGPVMPVDAARIGLRVLEALRVADAGGVRHRDLTPANVLVTRDGQVTVAGFGLTPESEQQPDAPVSVAGSLDFMAPERAAGGAASLQSDLWSLGATLYAAVEGRLPFHRDEPLATLTAVLTGEPPPPRRAGALRPVIDGLLVKNPEHRLGISDARRMLEGVVRGVPVPAPRQPPTGANGVARVGAPVGAVGSGATGGPAQWPAAAEPGAAGAAATNGEPKIAEHPATPVPGGATAGVASGRPARGMPTSEAEPSEGTTPPGAKPGTSGAGTTPSGVMGGGPPSVESPPPSGSGVRTPPGRPPGTDIAGPGTPGAGTAGRNGAGVPVASTAPPGAHAAASSKPASIAPDAGTPSTGMPPADEASGSTPEAESPATGTPRAATPAADAAVEDTASAGTPATGTPGRAAPPLGTPAAGVRSAGPPGAATAGASGPGVDAPAGPAAGGAVPDASNAEVADLPAGGTELPAGAADVGTPNAGAAAHPGTARQDAAGTGAGEAPAEPSGPPRGRATGEASSDGAVPEEERDAEDDEELHDPQIAAALAAFEAALRAAAPSPRQPAVAEAADQPGTEASPAPAAVGEGAADKGTAVVDAPDDRAPQDRTETTQAEATQAGATRADATQADATQADATQATDPRPADSPTTDSGATDGGATDNRAPDDRAPDDRPEAARADASRVTDDRAPDDRTETSQADASRADASRATDPRATDPRATDPRATDPRATDPREPVASRPSAPVPAQRRLIPPLPPPARPVNGHPAPATGSAAAELNGLAQPQARLAPPARPGPTPPPTPGIDHLSWGGSPSRRRTVITAGIAVLVVVAAVLIPYLVHRSRDDGIGATAPVTPPAASTAGPASPEPAAPPPAGFRLHRDPTGFSIAVPTGWREERDGSLVDFRDPTSSRFIRIDQRNNPRTDPYDDWIRQEPTSKQRLPGYDLIRIGAVQYRGWPTADWEFTWGPRGGQRSHVRIRNVVPNDFHGYAIYWSTTDGQWTQDLPYFDVLVRTFAPKEER